MRRLFCYFCLAAFALGSSQAAAQFDKYQLSDAERTACTPDAQKFCLATYPNEDRLLTCMKANRKVLSTECRVAFDAGLKKRGLN